jgi:hypothetical protein
MMMEQSLTIQFLAIIVGVTIIQLFYYSFRSKWPEIYFSTTDFTSIFIRISAKRYFGFRLLPILIVCSTLVSILVKNDSYGNLPIGLFTALIFSLNADGKIILDILRKSNNVHTFFNKYQQILIHLFSIIAISFVGWMGDIVGQTKTAQTLTPTLNGLVDNIWSSILIALFVVYFYKLYEQESDSTYRIFEKSLSEIGDVVRKTIKIESNKRNIDNELVTAICIIENIQRPKWFRHLEKIKSLFIKEGSYGIMQVHASNYIDDKESITRAIRMIPKNTIFPNYPNNKDEIEDKVKHIALTYNNDNRYSDLVWDSYEYLKSQLLS